MQISHIPQLQHPQEPGGRMWGLNWSIIEMSSPLSSHFHAQSYSFCSRGLVCAGELAITAAVTALAVIVAFVNLEGHLGIHLSFLGFLPSSHFIVTIFGRRASPSPDVYLHPFTHKRHAQFTSHNVFWFSHTACRGACFSCIVFTSDIIGNQVTDSKRRTQLWFAYYYP